MSIIGDALQRAEREGAPLDAPRPAVAAPRPALDVSVAPQPKTAPAPRRKGQPSSTRARRRVSPATVVLFVLAGLTVYMLADPRWSGSNWGIDPLRVPPASIDAHAPLGAEAAPPSVGTVLTLGSDSGGPPAAAIEPLSAEPIPPVPKPELPAAEAAGPDFARRYILSGVMLGGSTRLAVINGAIVEIGQMIDGAEVVAISRRDATLSIGGQKVRIAMQAEGIRRAERDGSSPPRRPGPD